MKRINNKGFTLVELLAVLVILITILTIAIPTITSSIDRNKEKILRKKIEIIKASAETFVSQYKNTFDNFKTFENGNCCIPVEQLTKIGILRDDDLVLDKNEKIEGNICYNNKKYVHNEEDAGKPDCTFK